MPVIPSTFDATQDLSALKLARYAQIIRYEENAFFGINAPDNESRYCRQVWMRKDRDMIARNLNEAQVMIERVLRYPLGQKWFEDEQHRNTRRFFTTWSRVRSLGVRAVTNISLNVALSHATDPATIPATATAVTIVDEIRFYEHDTDNELFPDTLAITGGNIVATFPRARLVKSASQDNPQEGWPYADTDPSGPFIQALDIKRVYTDTTDVGEFVWPLGKENCPECGEDTEPACGYIYSDLSGIVKLLPLPVSQNCIWAGAENLRINYCAGLDLDSNSEDAIIHLAHALMSVMPCEGCDPLMMLWKLDRTIPDEITTERADALFGVQEGAWRSYIYAKKNRHVRMSFI